MIFIVTFKENCWINLTENSIWCGKWHYLSNKKIERDRCCGRVTTIVFAHRLHSIFCTMASSVESTNRCARFRHGWENRRPESAGRRWCAHAYDEWRNHVTYWCSRQTMSLPPILCLALQNEELFARSVFHTLQRAGGVRNIFASWRRKGPAARERRHLELIVWLLDWLERTSLSL